MNFFNKKIKTAFSLIEISIVILIIGVAISGIVSGMYLFYDFKLGQAQSMTAKSPVISTPNLTLWLEATSTNSFETERPLNNDKIAIWKDINPQRTFKINVSQSDLSKQPTYIDNAINNLPALKFVNDIELRSDNIFLNDIFSSDQATIFLVQNNFSGDLTTTTISWVPTSNNLDGGSETARISVFAQTSNLVIFDYGIAGGAAANRVTTSTLTDFNNKNKIISFLKNSNNSDLRINYNETVIANSGAVATVSASLSAPIIVGKFRTNSDYFFNGNIGEIIIFDRALNENERKKIEDYLGEKWGINITRTTI